MPLFRNTEGSHNIPTYFYVSIERNGPVFGRDLYREQNMSSRSDAACERTHQTQSLEETTYVPLALLNVGKEHKCCFLREEIDNSAGIRGGERWINWSWGGVSKEEK
jgi:hypothetical protein